MKLLWVVGGVGVLVAIVFIARKAMAAPEQNLATAQIPGWAVPIYSEVPSKGGGGHTAKSRCEQVYKYNSAGISEVPNKNAKYVGMANDGIAFINCGAVGLIEKGASKTWKAIKSIF